MSKGPLATLKVVEFAGLGPAPLAGQLLADLGAEVTVIDRASAPAQAWDINRRGKSSIALNLKSDAGHAAAMRLIAQADVVIEGFRPGVMEKLSLGPDDCPETLVYARMTGWGQSGPLAQTAGHDLTYLALTGVLHMIGPKDDPPLPPLNLVADFGGGTMFLLLGILSAIFERGVSGKGQVVDAAMIDGVPALAGMILGWLGQGTWQETRGSNLLDGGAPFYRCYACSDGKHIAFAALEPQFFAEFVDLAGVSDADKALQYDRAHWPDMHARYEALFASRPRDAWAALFAPTDACVAPVLTLEEAAAHPHNAARAMYLSQHDTQHPHPAPRFSRSVAEARPVATAPGADAETVLKRLGYSETEIAALRQEGVLT